VSDLVFERGNDTVEFSMRADGFVSVVVDEPWAGDTHTGFGRRGYGELSVEQAKQLMEWLAIKLVELAARERSS